MSESIQPVVFRSESAQLMVSFPEEQFGMGENAKGEPAPYPNVRFQAGMYQTTNPRMVELMRKHPCIEGNGNGNNEFWEEKPEVTQAVNLASGEIVVANPDSSLVDKEKMAVLVKHYNTSIHPTKEEQIQELITWAIDTFEMKGVSKPKKDLSGKRLKARLVEVLGALEDAKVWSADEGRTDS